VLFIEPPITPAHVRNFCARFNEGLWVEYKRNGTDLDFLSWGLQQPEPSVSGPACEMHERRARGSDGPRPSWTCRGCWHCAHRGSAGSGSPRICVLASERYFESPERVQEFRKRFLEPRSSFRRSNLNRDFSNRFLSRRRTCGIVFLAITPNRVHDS